MFFAKKDRVSEKNNVYVYFTYKFKPNKCSYKNIILECITLEKSTSTGVATILVNQQGLKNLYLGNNCIILTPGANGLVDSKYVETSLTNNLQDTKILLVQMEIHPNATLTALKIAKKNNSKINIYSYYNFKHCTSLSRDYYRILPKYRYFVL